MVSMLRQKLLDEVLERDNDDQTARSSSYRCRRWPPATSVLSRW